MHKDVETVAYLVHDLARLMRTRFDARARTLGATRQQWRVLLVLSTMDEGPTQAELAERLDVEPITLCRMVDRLSDAGLVERRADPRDRRVRRVHLMSAAHGIIDKLNGVAGELEREILDVLTPEAQGALRDSLTRLREGLRHGEKEREVA